MSKQIETQIVISEERLRLAMLRSDVSALNEILAPGLVFTNHVGQILSKNDDLTAHESGIIKIETLVPSEQIIQIVGDVAVVSVRMRLEGSYAGVISENDFRFTRIWSRSVNGIWKVMAAHSSIIQ